MRRFASRSALLRAASRLPLQATVLVPIEFRELVADAPVIVHGRVVDVPVEWVDGRRAVETFVTSTADEYLKGDLGEHVTFRVPGGQIGRYRTVFVGAPEFKRRGRGRPVPKTRGPSYPVHRRPEPGGVPSRRRRAQRTPHGDDADRHGPAERRARAGRARRPARQPMPIERSATRSGR